jgi:deazaflavin-dependent oxidoreductase (nitroreductase family)
MHLPRDPGEWLFMAVLMAAVMAVGMIGAHSVRSHLGGTSHRNDGAARGDAGPMSPGPVMTAATWVVGRLLALGIPVAILGPMMLLTITGRKSGQPRTLPVDVHDLDGRRYLIASHGIGSWVLNLRAAGTGTLRLGRRRLEFEARELEPSEAGPVIRRAFSRLVATDSWRGRGIRANLGVTPASPEADYVASAREHPVFELRATARRPRALADGPGK